MEMCLEIFATTKNGTFSGGIIVDLYFLIVGVKGSNKNVYQVPISHNKYRDRIPRLLMKL
jgi:hypothetical protein